MKLNKLLLMGFLSLGSLGMCDGLVAASTANTYGNNTYGNTYAQTQPAASVTWYTNYDEAVRQSQATGRPIVLFFTGSDWCTWCNKLEDEVFHSSEFVQDSGNKYIFVKLDFPLKFSLDPTTTQQNSRLQKQYDIKGYPTVILLDSQQRLIGESGYRAGGGKSYAAYLKKLTDGQSAFSR